MKRFRLLLAAPFLILGACVMMAGELVAGEKHTFRGDEVREQIEKKRRIEELAALDYRPSRGKIVNAKCMTDADKLVFIGFSDKKDDEHHGIA